MNKKVIAGGFILGALFLSACSSSAPTVEIAEHPEGRGIRAIDEMIVEMKGEFIHECYTPIVEREVPETKCQTDLFQLLERRFHMNYKKNHVDMASDDLFFRQVDERLRMIVRKDPSVRDQVREHFSNYDDLLSYYKNLYGFSEHTIAN